MFPGNKKKNGIQLFCSHSFLFNHLKLHAHLFNHGKYHNHCRIITNIYLAPESQIIYNTRLSHILCAPFLWFNFVWLLFSTNSTCNFFLPLRFFHVQCAMRSTSVCCRVFSVFLGQKREWFSLLERRIQTILTVIKQRLH